MNIPTNRPARSDIVEYLAASGRYFALPELSFGIISAGGRVEVFERDKAQSAAAVYKVGSLTKLVTALAVLKLQEDGRLSLGDAVSRHLPWLGSLLGNGAGEARTILDLLRHTSGLPRGKVYHTNPAADELLESLRGLEAPLGSDWERRVKYSNLGYILLGMVIEAVSQEPYASLVRRRIFAPLGMERSGFGNETVGSAMTTPHRLACFREGSATPYDYEEMPLLPAPHTSFDMFSTVQDFSRLLSCLLQDGRHHETRVLEPGSMAALWSSGWPMGGKVRSGLGFYTVETPHGKVWYENGEHFGHSASMLLIPEKQFALVGMTNRGSAGLDLSCMLNTVTRCHMASGKRGQLSHDYHKRGSVTGSYVSPDSALTIRESERKLYASIDGEDESPLIYRGQNGFLKLSGASRKYPVQLHWEHDSVRGLSVGPSYFQKEPRRSAAPTMAPAAGVAGIYRNSSMGRVALFVRNGQLILAFSPFKEAVLEQLAPGRFVQRTGPFAEETVAIDERNRTLALGTLRFEKTAEQY